MDRPKPVTKRVDDLRAGETIFVRNKWVRIQSIEREDTPGMLHEGDEWVLLNIGAGVHGPRIMRHIYDNEVVGFLPNEWVGKANL